ncbi:MAG: preprotein translocase subunit YajC [Chloroflexi bacterium]|nr:preprotein translocase subunit YajC [Chloroflexota bacterium]
MANLELAIVLFIVALFGVIVFWMIRSQRKEQETKSRISQALGFTPLQPTPELLRKIARLYHAVRTDRKNPDADKYQLENVAAKRMPDCDLFIFDLVDTSGDETSYPEQQAVAVVSPHLNLPAFIIFPKADIESSVTHLGNRFLGWVIGRLGNVVEFPQVPGFGNKYLVSSPDPEGTRAFLDDAKLHHLATTRLLNVHACGDIFALSRMEIGAKSLTEEIMRERVALALKLFWVWQKKE